MKSLKRPTFRLEVLEDRVTPALNIIQSGSVLNITGTLETGTLDLATTPIPGQIQITGSTSTTVSGVNSVYVNLGPSTVGNFVFVDLQANPLNGNLSINAGPSLGNSVIVLDNANDTSNTDLIGNLTITRGGSVTLGSLGVLGNVTINNSQYSTPGALVYTIGGVNVTGSMSIVGCPGIDFVGISATTVNGNLTANLGNSVSASNAFSLDVDSLVRGSLNVTGGAGGTAVDLFGDVNQNVIISLGSSGFAGNSFRFYAESEVGGLMSVQMGAAGQNAGGNQIQVFEGTINGNLTVTLAKSNLNLFNFGATVRGRLASISFATGVNTFTVYGTPSLPNPYGRMNLYMPRYGVNTFTPLVPITWPLYIYS